MVFIKRLRLGMPGKDIVLPGEDVTPDISAFIGAHRMKVWWNARVIGSREFAVKLGLLVVPEASLSPAPAAAELPQEPEAACEESDLPPNVKSLGGNSYDVLLRNGKWRMVKGLDKALKVALSDS
jgi:hypothetical protein